MKTDEVTRNTIFSYKFLYKNKGDAEGLFAGISVLQT